MVPTRYIWMDSLPLTASAPSPAITAMNHLSDADVTDMLDAMLASRGEPRPVL